VPNHTSVKQIGTFAQNGNLGVHSPSCVCRTIWFKKLAQIESPEELSRVCYQKRQALAVRKLLR